MSSLYRPELGRAAANEPPLPLTVFGAGYVGLVTAACFAGLGHTVLCIDTDVARVAQLSRGQLPFFEPGLEDLIVRNGRLGRLRFTNDVDAAVAHAAVQFIAVGTPCGRDGAADIRNVLAVARQIGARAQRDTLIVCKSTAPVGTAEQVAQAAHAELTRRGASWLRLAVVSNPEFLREGTAVEDFMQPDRVVVGAADERALHTMHELYRPLLKDPQQWLAMDVRGAELTKYACNVMLATRLSLMNELAQLADRLQVDIEDVRRGVASDPRIGRGFLSAGCGFGGSCLPKDLRALQRTAADLGVVTPTLNAVEQTNARQKGLLARRTIELFGGSLVGRRIALWGLAFKPGTDDLREAPSETLITALAAAGARIVAHDPVAMPAARRRFSDVRCLTLAVDAMHAVDGADALLIATEWPEYRRADWAVVRARMAAPHVLDGRNICDPARMAALGFIYRGIGRQGVEKISANLTRVAAEEPLGPPMPVGMAGALPLLRGAFTRA